MLMLFVVVLLAKGLVAIIVSEMSVPPWMMIEIVK